jgi:hypothetical protein
MPRRNLASFRIRMLASFETRQRRATRYYYVTNDDLIDVLFRSGHTSTPCPRADMVWTDYPLGSVSSFRGACILGGYLSLCDLRLEAPVVVESSLSFQSYGDLVHTMGPTLDEIGSLAGLAGPIRTPYSHHHCGSATHCATDYA